MENLILLSQAYVWFVGLLVMMIVMTVLFVVMAFTVLKPIKMDSQNDPYYAKKLLEKREAELTVQLLNNSGDAQKQQELEGKLREVAAAEKVVKELMSEEYGVASASTDGYDLSEAEAQSLENEGAVSIEQTFNTTPEQSDDIKRSFTAKLMQSSDEVKVWYFEIKNCILCYEKTKAKMRWNNEQFYIGRRNVATLTMRGKTLSLYLALNPDEFADTFKVRRTQSDNYTSTPCLFRIKSDKDLKSAKELVSLLMSDYGVMYIRTNHSIYALPYEDDDALVVKGLARPNDDRK